MQRDKHKSTIYDVAAEAGVAISTVSRVLNDSPDVAESTRARVKDAIRTLNFRPDRIAKKLAQQQTPSIAIAVPTFTTPFHNELLKGVRSHLRDLDLDLLLCDLGSENRHVRLLDFLRRGAVSGLLLAGVVINDKIRDELLALQAPVVLVGTQSPEFDSFLWDDIQGAGEAVKHLIDRGHRRIAMIRSHSASSLQDARIKGYINALSGAGIPAPEELIQTGASGKHAGYSEETGYEAMLRILRLDPRPTAVFASSDTQAFGATKAIREAGLRIPEDISLVGYDDVKTSEYIGLSSIDQSIQEIGARAAERLISRAVDGKHLDPVAVVTVPKLKVRRSSDYVIAR